METSAKNIKLLEVGLREVKDQTEKEMGKKSIIPSIFDIIPSDKAQEQFYYVTGLGDHQPWTGKLAGGSMSPGYFTKMVHNIFSLSNQLARDFIKDNQYDVMKNMAKNLEVSRLRTREKDAVKLWADMFSVPFGREEGLPICYSAHTTKVQGVSTATGFSNLGTSSLNKLSLQVARLAFRKMRLDGGEMQDEEANILVIPSKLRPQAEEAIGETPHARSDKDGDTLNLVNTEYGRWTILELLRLDDYDENSWFVTNMPMLKDSAKWCNRDSASGMLPIDNTLGPTYYSYDRWGKVFKNWRAVLGNLVQA